ncbi:hypothetical protein ACB098_06G233000 [Castanea mollissima]
MSLERLPKNEGIVPYSELLLRLRPKRLGKNEKLKARRVPFKPEPVRFLCATLINSLQEIPLQLQGLFPTHEEKTDWFWLSRLVCHFRSASTCPSVVAVGDEVTKEAENDAKMRMMIYLNMTSKAAI